MQAEGELFRVEHDALDRLGQSHPRRGPPVEVFGRRRYLIEQPTQQSAHLASGQARRVRLRLVLIAQARQLVDELGTLVLQVFHPSQHRRRVVQLGGQVDRAADLRGERDDALLDAGEPAAVDHLGAGQVGDGGLQGGNGIVTAQILAQSIEDRGVDARGRHLAPLAEPVEAAAVGVPAHAVRRDQQAAQQHRRLPHAPTLQRTFLLAEDRLGLFVADQRRVRVAVNQPLAPRPALDGVGRRLAAVGVHVPHGVAGVGESLPIHRVRAARWPGQLQARDRHAARDPLRSQQQVATNDAGGLIVDHQATLGDRRALAHGAGGVVLKAVATRRLAAGTPALAHVLCHPGQALLPAVDAVPFVHGLQHRREQHLGGRVGVGHVAIDDAHAALLAVLLEELGHHAAPGHARRVEAEHMFPAAAGLFERVEQPLKGGAIVVLPGLDRISEFVDNDQASRQRQVMQRAALRVDRDITPVFAGPKVEDRAVAH